MKPRIKIVNPESFIQALRDADCRNTPFVNIDNKDSEYQSFDITPPEGFESPKNFPDCCNYHESVAKYSREFFNKFPNCCPSHSKLNAAKWFNKSDYSYIQTKIVNQLSYTESQIEKFINSSEWYKEITDYIEYNYYSFGQLPEGFGSAVGLSLYLDNLKQTLKNEKEIPKEKGERLIEFIDSYYKPQKETKRDFNILYNTFQKWLKAFPFEISFFSGLKAKFANSIPLSNSKPVYNKYLKVSKVRLFTASELVDVLIDKTNELISQVDAVKLVEQGMISDIDKQALELINEAYQFEIRTLSEKYTKKEMKYIIVLRNWRQLGKEYFKDIAPYYKKVPQQTTFKPVFSSEAIPILYDILKEHFPKKQQSELKRILDTGETAKEILFFRDNGNRLADAFKQLYEVDLITGCDKKELESWIAKNFEYRSRGVRKTFKPRYLSDIISTTQDKCKNPLLNVKLNLVTGTYQVQKHDLMKSNRDKINYTLKKSQTLGNISYQFNDRLPKLFEVAKVIKNDFERLEKFKQVLAEADRFFYEYAKIEQLPVTVNDPPEIINFKDLDGEVVSTQNYQKRKEKEFEILEEYKFELSHYGTKYSDLYERLKFLHPEKMAGKEEFLSAIVKAQDSIPESTQSLDKKKKVKSFHDFILHRSKTIIAEGIRNTFTTEKGKYIKLLFMALEARKLIVIGNRQFKMIYESFKAFVCRDIGTYQSVNDYKYNDVSDKPDLENTLLILDHIIEEAEKS